MTVLITGSHGFVGSNLEGDYKASRADADLRDFDQANALFARVKPTTIIHTAAKHGNYAQIEEDKVGYYRENALININVFEAARLNSVENLIAFSSVTAFPDRLNKFSEADLYDGEPHVSCYPYAYAKRIIEVLCRAYTEQYGLNYNCIFLANAYGPNGKDNVIPVLINKCINAQRCGLPFEILGDGTPRRDFIFIEDVSRIINRLIHIKHSGPLILSSGTSVSVREVVNEIVRANQFEGNVVWKPDNNLGQLEKIPSNLKLRRLFPNLSFTPISSGIEKTVGWHNQQHQAT